MGRICGWYRNNYHYRKPLVGLSIQAENGESKLYDVDVSDMQGNDIVFGTDSVTGTLKYLSGSNAITDVWGEGYFLCFNMYDNTWTGLDKVMVGMQPSVSSGLVDILPDDTKNGIAKVTDKNAQKFVIVQTATDGRKHKQVFDLSKLTLEAPAEG